MAQQELKETSIGDEDLLEFGLFRIDGGSRVDVPVLAHISDLTQIKEKFIFQRISKNEQRNYFWKRKLETSIKKTVVLRKAAEKIFFILIL